MTMMMKMLSLRHGILVLLIAGVFYTSDAFTSKSPQSCFGCHQIQSSSAAAAQANTKKTRRDDSCHVVTATCGAGREPSTTSTTTARFMTATDAADPQHSSSRRMGELTLPEQKTFDVMQALHDAKFNFRIVVVGNGAILESTSPLGPTMKVSQSPKTGKNLMTLASQDQSLEFHLQLADVSKIVLVQRETPKRTMRLVRFLEAEHGNSMCSLILADDSSAAQKWFDDDLIGKFGTEIQL
jgi:hypothetical protein